jgi:uncharacterized protein (DUF305 family)
MNTNFDKKTWLVGGGALVVGVVGGFLVATADGHRGHDDRRSDDQHEQHAKKEKADNADMQTHDMSTMMADMNAALAGKSGPEFDAAFLREMIVHHEGAVDMAKAALNRASDPRIKALAAEIITAQEAEISEMKSWQEK